MAASKFRKVQINTVTGGRRSGELKRFLRAMRARLDPLAVGLETPGRRRRARGLRIDEAAMLANVGVTWYTALEAGKDIGVSAKRLDRVAAALRLNSEEREYLFALAKPKEARRAATADIATLRPVIDGFTVGPGFICDRFWNVYASNDAANRVYGHAQSTERNLLARLLFEPAFRALHEDWEAVAHRMVGMMHASFGRMPDDSDGVATIERLRAASPQFTAWWSDFRLARYEPSVRIILHPQLGRLRLLFTAFIASSMVQRDDYLMIVLQSPLDDETRERLRK